MLTRYHLAVADFNNSGKTLIRDIRSGVTVLIDPSIYESLRRDGSAETVADADLRELVRRNFIVPDRDADKTQALNRINGKIAYSDILSVTLMVTDACNMECSYCFQNGLLENKTDFTPDLIEPLADWILNRALAVRARTVMMHFYGGEPLMNLPLISRVVKRVRPMLARHRIVWKMTLTTNGSLLTKPVSDRLFQMGCSLAIISLDGPPEIHDLRRPLKTRGRSSYDAVLRGIENGLRRFRVMVRTNIDRQNKARIPDLMDRLGKAGFARRPGFSYSLEVVGPVQYPTRHVRDFLFGIKESGMVIKELLKIQSRKGLRIFGNMPSEVSCEHIMKNAFTIDSRGYLFPCPGFVGFNDFRLGRVTESIDLDRMNDLYGVKPWEREPCLSCRYLPQCHGGCRSCAVIRGGDCTPKGYDRTYCRKAFFDETFPTFLEHVYGPERTNVPVIQESVSSAAATRSRN